MKFLKEINGIHYFNISIKKIDKIKQLWQESGKYHANLSKNFSEIFYTSNFEERMKKLISMEKIYITLAMQENQKLGFCLSSIENDCGELSAFFVNENFRRKGIGGVLIKDHLFWLKENASSIRVAVLYENEKTFELYRKYGFEAFSTTMLLIKEK